jgi:uncharacterized protein (TIGR02145 family)
MKNKIRFIYSVLIIIGILLIVSTGCKKTDKIHVPVLTTSVVSKITETTATCGGIINSDGGADITSRGVIWSYGRNPAMNDSKTIDGGGTGSFTSNITGLVKNTTYYLMAYATNSGGTGYGNIISLTTLMGNGGSVIDIDGNIYDTAIIGTQVWLVQNLKVTHYRNGDTIANLKDNTQWCNFTIGAYCNYNNDINNVPVYGRLYNWYAIADNRNIAPADWHVATDHDWAVLINNVGGDSIGGVLKESGTIHWQSPNTGAINKFGFTALPAGTRFGQYGIPGYGTFTAINETSEWWTHDEQCTRGMSYNSTNVYHSIDSRWSDGFSVRCVKGN